MHIRVAEYLFFFGLQLIWCILGVGIWIVAAYSKCLLSYIDIREILTRIPIRSIAGLVTLLIAPLVLLLPAIFLPIISRRARIWLSKWRERGVFHKYDWNIIWGLLAIVSYLMTFVMIMSAPSLWQAWTHEVIHVSDNVTYSQVKDGAIFTFDADKWVVNTTMMGYKEMFACDDNGCTPYYNCFAPILPRGELGPNIFWAMCPYNKENCTALLSRPNTCVSRWNDSAAGGVISPLNVEADSRAAIAATAERFGMPPGPPAFVCLRWDDVQEIYRRALFFWLLSLGIGQGVVTLWILFRRLLLSHFCGPYNNPHYKVLS